MFGIDHGQPGSSTVPEVLDPTRAIGTAGYAAWAERNLLISAAAEAGRENRRTARLRQRAVTLRCRADRAEALLRRQQRYAG